MAFALKSRTQFGIPGGGDESCLQKLRPVSLTLVIGHLRLGGAERVISLMANHWADKGWRVTLLTLEHGTSAPFYPIRESVRHIDFNWPGAVASGIPKMRTLCALVGLRTALRRSAPQAIISFLNTTNIRVLMATYGMRLPVIVSERSDPHYDPISTFWERRRRWFYPTAASVVAQTEEAVSFFPAGIRTNARVIPNPAYLPDGFVSRPAERVQRRTAYTLIAMGRLVAEKGFDSLLQAFARVSSTYRKWNLTIWGEGPDRGRLEEMIRDLRVTGQVHLPGRTDQPFEKYRQADLYVLCSRYEGFPNALCEAMACGLPVISFDCPSGPRQIIRDGVDGLLVPPGDVGALAETLGRLMGEEALRTRLASRAPEILKRYSLSRIMGMWESLLRELAEIKAT